ncbi:MAG: PIN domain-containing protein, partial [Acidobacteriota bacterium]
MRTVVVDANVLVSFFVDRNAKQRDAADALLQLAEAGQVTAIVPQFVVFETAYVLQSQYGITGQSLASMIHDIVTTPGVQTIDTCPWRRVFELWPSLFSGLADASIVAVATTHRYDAIATFDQKLSKRAKDVGV